MIKYIYKINQPKKPTKKKEESTNYIISFKYQNELYDYKDTKSFYKDIKALDMIQPFIHASSDKERVLKTIQLYYPDSKVIHLDI